MLKFVVKTPQGKNSLIEFGESKSFDCVDSALIPDGGYHSPLQNKRSISFDNLHLFAEKTKCRERGYSVDCSQAESENDSDIDDNDKDTDNNRDDLLIGKGHYNTIQASLLGSQNYNTLRMMISMFKPKIDHHKDVIPPFSRAILRESVREGRHTVAFYMNQLCRHLDPQLQMRNPPKKLLKGLVSIERLLTSLEVDLRSNPNATWLREFIDEPNSGHVILLKFLKYLQDNSNSGNTSLERVYKGKKTEQILVKEPTDEHLCLLCLKAIVRNKYGFFKVLSAPRSLSTMVFCLRLSNFKTKIAVLKILSEACEHPGGFEKTLQAFEDYKQVKQEKFRFESVVHSVIYRGRLNNPAYMESVLYFFNALLSNAPSLNQRVFHQQELEQAGFSAAKVESTLDGVNSDGLQDELSKWRTNYIDVSSTLDEFVSLRGRSQMLRDEVDLLQEKLETLQREKNLAISEKSELVKKIDEYKQRASELQYKIESIKRQHPENTTDTLDITDAIENVVDEILRPSTPVPPPPPPPPTLPSGSIPPPPPSPFNSSTNTNDPQFKKSKTQLPMLHWQAIQDPPGNSIFSNFQKSNFEKKINFDELDKLFEIKKKKQSLSTSNKEKPKTPKVSKVTLLNPEKSRSMLITKRRINLPEFPLQRAINSYDIVQLPPEFAELLIKYIPTQEERTIINNNMASYDNMGEAEQFIAQLMKIERLESKLSTMVYMGTFDELFRSTTPQIEAIVTASVTVQTSEKFKKILQIILTIGNYMNGSRKGFAKGFKLESLLKLEDVKSNNRKTSLMQYLVTLVKTRFPDHHDFHKEIDVVSALTVSMETLASDVQQLRKGLDVTKQEKEKQADNYALHNFFHRAVLKVQQIGERYRKMEETYREVCHFFCEDSRTTDPAHFFSNFQKFIELYKNTSKQMETQLKEDKVMKKAKLLQAQNQKIKDVAAFSSKMAAQAMKRRKSDQYFDQNENLLSGSQKNLLSPEITTNDRLSLSCPRATSIAQMVKANSNPALNRSSDTQNILRTRQNSEGEILASPEINRRNRGVNIVDGQPNVLSLE